MFYLSVGAWLAGAGLAAAAEPDFAPFAKDYQEKIQPLVARLCQDCHSGDEAEAEIDLAAFDSFDDVRHNPLVWKKVREILASGQMPPQDAEQPTDEEAVQLKTWLGNYLKREAAIHAGDPGPVATRRLNNAQYTYTIRDLTGVDSLDPVREFPVDGAAGEGFTNAANALAMSPGLVTKYLDAAKQIAGHAVLLPDGLRFSAGTSRRDWTDEALARVREFYGRYSVSGGDASVNLQGVDLVKSEGGRLPVAEYLRVTLAERERLGQGKFAEVAAEKRLSAKYLATLWKTLNEPAASPSAAPLDVLKQQWKTATPADAEKLAAGIESWQGALWKFNQVGQYVRHLGATTGPNSWMESISPLVPRQNFRIKLTPAEGQPSQDITVHLASGDAGDGNADDFVVWESPRIVAPGRPDLPLRDVRAMVATLAQHRKQVADSTSRALAAVAAAGDRPDDAAIAKLAEQHQVEPAILSAWLETLGLRAGKSQIDGHLVNKATEIAGYKFIQGWQGPDALSVLANSTDEHVRIPGNMKPHGVAMHPAPKARAVAGWRSPAAQTVRISGKVQHAHAECGNGVVWIVELRRGNTRQILATGGTQGAVVAPFGPVENVAVREGDVISLAISPRGGDHSCDMTAVDLAIAGEKEWDLARDVSPNILAANPHDDSFGNPGVWHFFSEADNDTTPWVIPAGSLLARWQSSPSAEEKTKLADELQKLLQNSPEGLAADAPDAVLRRQLLAISSPFAQSVRKTLLAGNEKLAGEYGLDPALFGKHPQGAAVSPNDLCLQAPATIAVKLPAELLSGAELVTDGTLHSAAGGEASVQLKAGTDSSPLAGLSPGLPIVVRDGSSARLRFETSLAAIRELFPAALCYTKIVPVDEVVTLTLMYREDEHLRRLILDEKETAQLDRLWSELNFISQEPLLLVAAYEQIMEFATQDRPDKVTEFTPLKGAVMKRAADFEALLVSREAAHLEGVVELAGRAYRRKLNSDETESLRAFYRKLRGEPIGHEEAIRLTLARVLVSPAFLYRIEEPRPGTAATTVSGDELATRLSYFLTASLPDEELRRAAESGQLNDTEQLLAQTRRLLKSEKVRRLSAEFAAQWLHVYQFDQHDEKSESHFPEFAELRGSMYEESIRFFTDMFQNDGSLLSVLDADHTFVNDRLAKHYGIAGVEGPEWRRVDGVRAQRRGGVLTQASVLAKQSGASRTSPILRGTWLSEVVLGEKLPKPPKDVPVLAELPPEGLTERQLTELHTTVAACAKCHVRIDPFGFALENYDAIGRYREKDTAGLAIDSSTRLVTGKELAGLDGLKEYLLKDRRDDVLRQFNRKLLGYALGRGVQLSDEPLLDAMLAALAARDYHVSAAIETVVLSPQFREIRGRDTTFDEATP